MTELAETTRTRLTTLLSMLIKRTEAGVIKWDKASTPGGDLWYEYYTTHNTVRMVTRPGPIAARVGCKVLDQYGEPLVEVWDGQVYGIIELFTAIKHSKQRVDNVLDALLASLPELPVATACSKGCRTCQPAGAGSLPNVVGGEHSISCCGKDCGAK